MAVFRATRLVAVVLLLLGGCGGSTVYSNYYNSSYSPDHVRFASAVGPTLAVIRDNPFPGDAGNAAVLAAMQERNYGPRLYFVQTPRPDDRYGYKVVMDFGSATPSTTLCQRGPTPSSARAASGRVVVAAAFCIGDLLLSDATGAVEGVSGPDDPRFRRLIGDILVALTPPYDPKFNDESAAMRLIRG